MEKQMSQKEAKFEAQQRQFEVFLVQMRAIGMPILEPAHKNTDPFQIEKVPIPRIYRDELEVLP
ncbi:unnamed protein product [Ilex paraguariensis]|uniref:Uncharacterized protein n=1 Tax=Ilex paraguariensis TaxID=185542 RepID=A0ABC8SSH3_9AQUA